MNFIHRYAGYLVVIFADIHAIGYCESPLPLPDPL